MSAEPTSVWGTDGISHQLILNLVIRVWAGVANIVFVPLYLAYIGSEGLGLIGLFSTILALAGLLDFGLSATLNRELARYTAHRDRPDDARDLVKTFQVLFWCVGVAICAVVIAFASTVSANWVQARKLPLETVTWAFVLMGIAIAAQWPINMYTSGLMGMQRQIFAGLLISGLATFRSVGALLVLRLLSPTVIAYFTWCVVSAVLGLVVTATALWKSLPVRGRRARFRLSALTSVWKFAAGLAISTCLSVVLTQIDKIVLSRILSLELFGYYVMAASVAASLGLISGSISSTVFPSLSRQAAMGNDRTLSIVYHRSSQIMAISVGPTALVLAAFSSEIVGAWTRNPEVGAATHVLISVLALSTGLNGMLLLPYALSLAHGWVRISVLMNGLSVLLLAPLTVLMALKYGIIGAAFAPVVLNVGYFLIFVHAVHRRYLRAESRRWYCEDIGAPLAIAILVVVVAKLVANIREGPLAIVWVGAVWLAATAGASLSMEPVRSWIKNYLRSLALL